MLDAGQQQVEVESVETVRQPVAAYRRKVTVAALRRMVVEADLLVEVEAGRQLVRQVVEVEAGRQLVRQVVEVEAGRQLVRQVVEAERQMVWQVVEVEAGRQLVRQVVEVEAGRQLVRQVVEVEAGRLVGERAKSPLTGALAAKDCLFVQVAVVFAVLVEAVVKNAIKGLKPRMATMKGPGTLREVQELEVGRVQPFLQWKAQVEIRTVPLV